MIVAGNKLYERCGLCGRLVCLNKFLFSSLHLCLTEEEAAAVQPGTQEYNNALIGRRLAVRDKRLGQDTGAT